MKSPRESRSNTVLPGSGRDFSTPVSVLMNITNLSLRDRRDGSLCTGMAMWRALGGTWSESLPRRKMSASSFLLGLVAFLVHSLFA